jgi:glycine cleavage system H lipoate-binding protein
VSEGGPDFAEPVLGFRIWELRDGALFGPAYDQRWEPGENVSDCRGGGTKHVAPAKDCRCGFNAYHDRLPRPTLYGERYVAGAMAAWGEIEWHRAGFRAERACVVALCFDPKDGKARQAELEEVARSYGIQLVPRLQLRAHAERFGRTLGSPTPARPAKRIRQTTRPLSLVPGGRGYWIGRHVIADWIPGGSMTVAMARALTRRVGNDARIVTITPGSEVAAGDAVAVLHSASGSFAIASPVAGVVTAINAEAISDPFLATVDPSEGGWLVELSPQGLLLDECPLVWGRRGREQYDGYTSRVGPDRALDDVRLAGHVASVRMSCAEDAVALMRRRLARQAERAAARLQAA